MYISSTVLRIITAISVGINFDVFIRFTLVGIDQSRLPKLDTS